MTKKKKEKSYYDIKIRVPKKTKALNLKNKTVEIKIIELLQLGYELGKKEGQIIELRRKKHEQYKQKNRVSKLNVKRSTNN